MQVKKYHKQIINQIALYLFCILLMFLSTVITRNGNITFLVFAITSLIILFRYKTLESILPYCIALLMNNSLVEYEISFLGSFTLTGIIKIYFILLLAIYLIRSKKHTNLVFGGSFLIIWLAYFALNAYINQTGIWNTLYSSSFTMIVCVVMQYVALKSDKYKLLLISGVLTGFIFVCLCGYLELAIGKTFFYSIWTGAERYRLGILRVGSTVSDPNFLSLTEVFSICILNIPFVKKIVGNRISLLLTILGSCSIVLTLSRTGIIALITAFILMTSNKHKKYIVVILPMLALIAVPIISLIVGSTDTVDVNSALSRNRIVELAMEMWSANPLIGHGNNAFYNVSISYLGNQRSTMNEYVNELVSYGLIGISFYICYFVILIKKCVGGFEKLLSNKNAIYYFSAIISWLIMSYSLDTYYKMLIWVLPSLVIATETLSKETISNG